MTTPIDELAGIGHWDETWNDATGVVRTWHDCHATLDAARSAPVPASNDRPDFEKVLREADAAMRDETGRQRSRTSYYWRDLADAIYAVWDKGHPDLRSGLTELGTDLARAITDELPVPASNVSGPYKDERALWEFIDHGKSPASNVSEGLREAVGDVIGRMSTATRTMDSEVREVPNGVISSWGATLRAAIAHAAPERMDVERLSAENLHDTMAALGWQCTGTHAVGEGLCQNIASLIAHTVLRTAVYQPDATEEAGR